MSIEQLYLDFNIPIAPQDHRHHREGWINTECPFCTGNPGYHLGFNENGKYFYCYRCEGKSVVYTISRLLDIPYSEAETLTKQYKVYSTASTRIYGDKLSKIGTTEFKLPTNAKELKRNHKQYLFKRGFNPNKLVREFDLKGTGPVSSIALSDGKKLQTKYRIVIPIMWNRQVVSWTARDVTGKQSIKYMTCPIEVEIVHHKFIVYCKNGKLPKEVGVWVEGPTDVWRVGELGFSTFGITYTQEQLDLIRRNFKAVYIWFDPDPQAQRQAKKAEAALLLGGIETAIIYSEEDPADMPQQEVDDLLRQINLK